MIKSFLCKKWICWLENFHYQNGKLKEEELKEQEQAAESVKRSNGEGENPSKVEIPKNLPFILSKLRYLFMILFLLSPGYWISQSKKKQEFIRKHMDFKPYRCVDWYVTAWLLFEVLTAFIIVFSRLQVIVIDVFLTVVFSIRLFELFQSWVNQFVLMGKWGAINVNRSLVLAIVGYIEIIVIGAIIKYTFGWYEGNTFFQAIYDSVNAMVANPSSMKSPMQYVQIMFAVLFAAVVIQHIVGRRSGMNGDII